MNVFTPGNPSAELNDAPRDDEMTILNFLLVSTVVESFNVESTAVIAVLS